MKTSPQQAAAGDPGRPDFGQSSDPTTVDRQLLDDVIGDARNWLKRQQRDDGHWIYVLEPDATMPAEFILYEHFRGEIDDALEARMADYIRQTQADDHGGWPLYYGGDFNISATVKAYWALKIVGDDIDAPHMARAREAILKHGGAARCNVLTRFYMALFGQVPWRAVPCMPVELMLLPKWFPFHISKISYWSRTTLVPMTVLAALKAKAENPRGTDIRELFVVPPEQERTYQVNPTGSAWGEVFLWLDRVLHRVEPWFPRARRKRAIEAAMKFITDRLNGEDGIGAIFPPMVFTVLSFKALGYPDDHPDVLTAKKAVLKLMDVSGDTAVMQPCTSPIWDTALIAHAMIEAGEERDGEVMGRAFDWLAGKQVLKTVGDYAAWRPQTRPGGWAFQYNNDYYPDVDDTAVVVMGLDRNGAPRFRQAIDRAVEWVLGMQSKDGGWGAFDADNTYYYLNHIPFADHGALLDPPTSDVTARCIGMLAQLGYPRSHPAIDRAVEFLKNEQEDDGSWFGRWGANYIYGTWSVLHALNAVGEDPKQPYIQKAVAWLKSVQREDGGWGEDCATYWEGKRDVRATAKASTASQTAWAVLGLMAAGEVQCEAVGRGINFLLAAPRQGSQWEEKWYTGVGFPRIFYLKYHGYSHYFPLWALARYRNLVSGNALTTPYGI
ncbi:MAG: squalene--hopene cyclase [Alphaproteobacteria bacterium]|nr:squalene--hopene cyclase [Alphaproteobacteria bacterium]